MICNSNGTQNITLESTAMESKTDPLKKQEHQHQHQLQHSATRRNALQHTAPWRAMSDGIQDHQHHTKNINIKIDININIQSNITKRDSKNNMINDTLQHTAAHCSTLQHTAIRCDTLQHSATHCTTSQPQEQQHPHQQHAATHCSTLQLTATHCKSKNNNINITSTRNNLFTSTPSLHHSMLSKCHWPTLQMCDMTHSYVCDTPLLHM